ncbi:hypothetical protein WN48_02589 [Eufriesea mexicana]|uniref:Uncharacterized protein n=1 Tax=Eufriesea mexicana TaxID=516756 RepID=A0A310SQ13_9HYME|nr:hypothetical protein WN48_02589 [Eufriesea mexicana]
MLKEEQRSLVSDRCWTRVSEADATTIRSCIARRSSLTVLHGYRGRLVTPRLRGIGRECNGRSLDTSICRWQLHQGIPGGPCRNLGYR